jgi:hypothetical protein
MSVELREGATESISNGSQFVRTSKRRMKRPLTPLVAEDEVVDTVRSVLDRRRPRPGRDRSSVELRDRVAGDLGASGRASDGWRGRCAGGSDVADLEGVCERVAVHLLVKFEAAKRQMK